MYTIIKGLLVKKYSDVETINYKLLDEIVKEEQGHVEELEHFLKEYQ